jgi:hypothetical protein
VLPLVGLADGTNEVFRLFNRAVFQVYQKVLEVGDANALVKCLQVLVLDQKDVFNQFVLSCSRLGSDVLSAEQLHKGLAHSLCDALASCVNLTLMNSVEFEVEPNVLQAETVLTGHSHLLDHRALCAAKQEDDFKVAVGTAC